MHDLTPQQPVEAATEQVSTVSCEDFRALQRSGAPHVLIDVREQDEWDAGHIEGAVHIPRGFLEFRILDAVPDKQMLLIMCCAKGGRAALAGQTLRMMGYQNIKVLEGGHDAYCASGIG